MHGRSESMVLTLECAYPRLNQAALVHFDIVRPLNGISVVGVGKGVTRIWRTWAGCCTLRLNSEDEEVSKGHRFLQYFGNYLEDDSLYNLDRNLCTFGVTLAGRIQLV
jgi:hypothetical protein